jgi:glycerophosphoryl diester phosphodiesterase
VDRTGAELEIIAHRGASAYAPENTFAAYDLALEQGAHALELDVRATADRELVVLHDPTLLRTAGDPRRADALTGGELAELDASVRPLTLDAVLARYGGRTRLLIDLKDPTPAWERLVVAAIERHGLRGRATVQSFDGAALRRLHRAAPWLAIVQLYHRGAAVKALEDVASFAGAIGPWHGEVDARLVRSARARGLAVCPWTVDAPADVDRLRGLGVAGVITNAPRIAAAA